MATYIVQVSNGNVVMKRLFILFVFQIILISMAYFYPKNVINRGILDVENSSKGNDC